MLVTMQRSRFIDANSREQGHVNLETLTGSDGVTLKEMIGFKLLMLIAI